MCDGALSGGRHPSIVAIDVCRATCYNLRVEPPFEPLKDERICSKLKFATADTEGVYNGLDTPRTRRLLPNELHEKAAQIMDRLASARELRDLSSPGLRLEKLGGKRDGQYSVRVNEQYRICFRWVNAEAVDVEITDYH